MSRACTLTLYYESIDVSGEKTISLYLILPLEVIVVMMLCPYRVSITAIPMMIAAIKTTIMSGFFLIFAE